MIEVPSVSREAYERNTARSRNQFSGTPTDQCFICGSRCVNPKYFIHVHHGGAYILAPGEKPPKWVHANGDMGLQAVGTSCVRKYPQLKGYIQKCQLCKACKCTVPVKGCHYCMSPEERMTRESSLGI